MKTEHYGKTKHGVWRTFAYDLSIGLDCLRYAARNPFAWPGGYDIVALCDDGGILCNRCVRENYALCYDSTKNGVSDGWKVEGIMCADGFENGETCSHCGRWLDQYNDETN